MMWNDVKQVVGIAFDLEIEPPAGIDAALLDIPSHVIFLCSQRWVAEILNQQRKLLIALLLNTQRGIRMAAAETFRVKNVHLGRFRSFRAVKRAKQR